MRLRLERRDFPVGELLIVTDESGVLRALDFADYEARMHGLLSRHYGVYVLETGAAPRTVIAALEAYFAGDVKAIDQLPTATAGTEFQRRVWKALRDIPPGRTETYGALAARLGKPSASRAVGAANGLNPVGIVVPCHRVIGANGSLTGYAGGLANKAWLLDHEKRHAG
jgi:O-6-methylguanine DNA methyltransferase